MADSPSTLADFTSESLIVPRLEGRDQTLVLCELSQVLHRAEPRWNADSVLDAAISRERLMCTAMGHETAFAHARLGIGLRTQFVFGRSPDPIVWGPPGSPLARLIFLIAVPENDDTCYLKLLSGLAKLGRDTALLDQLKTTDTSSELLALLGKIAVRK
jgi:PTS system fructose-specific IIC component